VKYGGILYEYKSVLMLDSLLKDGKEHVMVKGLGS
jgi:hypothetical protein